MHFSGAVEATKTLRTRENPIEYRVNVAHQILEGSVSVMLPRRHLVILEWIFDMLATDNAAGTSTQLWTLLAELWGVSADNGRRRIYRNHRFVDNLSSALRNVDSPTLLEAIAQALKAISSTVDILAFASDSQGGQLILAYLSSAARTNEDIGSIIFQAAKARKNIFGVKLEPESLNILLQEPSQSRRLHYLKDYFSEVKNSSVPSSDSNIEDVMQAVCESDINIQARFQELTTAFPQQASRLLEVLITLRPREASPALLDKLVSSALHAVDGKPDWKVMELCMHIDAAPALKHMKALLDAKPTDHVLALMISRSAALRSLPELLTQWRPESNPSQVVMSSLRRALESLSPVQVAPLITSESAILELLITSLTYKAAASPQVRDALQALLHAPVSLQVKLAVLDIAPSLQMPDQKNKKEIMISLRVSEIENHPVDLKSVVKQVKSESETALVLRRFYPLLEYSDSPKHLAKLFAKCDSHMRAQLTKIYGIYEFPKLTEALVETLLDHGEFEALLNVPKQILAWNQRHRIVDAVLKNGNSDAAALVIKLIDSANPPEVGDLSRILVPITAPNVETFIRLVKPVLRHHEYVEQLLGIPSLNEWQKNCLLALMNEKPDATLAWVKSNHQNNELRLPVLEVLSRLPQSAEVSDVVERLAVQLSSDPPELLFTLVCRYKYHWSIVSALFAFSNCRFQTAYTGFCAELSEQERYCLVMAAADENQHGVLRCLAAGRMIHGAQHVNAINTVIARCCFGDVEVTPEFAKLCDTLLRDQLEVVTPFGLEMIIAIITKLGSTGRLWYEFNVVLSHLLLLQRRNLRGRLHLVIAALTSLLEGVDSVEKASSYVRLMDNLCNPPQNYLGGASTRENLNSAVARDRRYIAKNLGVLLQNYVSIVLKAERNVKDATEINTALRPAAFSMMDVLGGENVRSLAAGLDSASRTYLRALYEDYAQNARWTSD